MIRTIPGVEVFDYAIPPDATVAVGDLIRIPFRKTLASGLVIEIKDESPFADRAVLIERPKLLHPFGSALVRLLIASAEHSFSSKPSVLNSWIRTVPKRAKEKPLVPSSEQIGLPVRKMVFGTDRLNGTNGLLETARHLKGRTLILAPWQIRARTIAEELDAPVLHGDVADATAWNRVLSFARGESPILVTTRIGAWLACTADTVLFDEPENDDFKQDEMSPRLDARWIVERSLLMRPELSCTSFSTTPRLTAQLRLASNHAPADIELDIGFELSQRRGSSDVEMLSSRAMVEIEEAVETKRSVLIIHPIVGQRARIRCRDCGWTAICPACTAPLSRTAHIGLCRSCGRKSPLPAECPSCGGSDFSGGRPGMDRVEEQCRTKFPNADIRILSPMDALDQQLAPNSLVVITDASLIGGAIEDTRRKERLLISWRRLAAHVASTKSRLIVQGNEETLTDFRNWLTGQGVVACWSQEMKERSQFQFPPAVRMAKILVDGTEQSALSVVDTLTPNLPQGWILRGPYPVPFRSSTRTPRHVIQLVCPRTTDESILRNLLNPIRTRAIIDLDPIAFFS